MDQIVRAIVAVLWGVINRFRGWGNGWGGTNGPAWLMWIQEKIFNRPILSAVQALATSGYQYSQKYGLAAAACLFLALFAGWWVGVAPGWGLYFAAFTGIWKIAESEIGWIDRIGLRLVPFVSETDERSNRRRGRICFALRGVYYIPMFLAIAAVHWIFVGWSWWLLLPVAFFWTDGVVYGVRWTKRPDNVRWCEPIGGTVRGAVVMAALYLAA